MDDNDCIFSDSEIGNKNWTVQQGGIGKEIDENKWAENESSILLGLNESYFRHQQEDIDIGDCIPEQGVSSHRKIGAGNNGLISVQCGFNNDDIMTVIPGTESFGRAYLASSRNIENDQQRCSEIRNSLWINDEGNVRRGDVVLKREWFKVGCFDNEKEMFRERLRGRVSRWKVRKMSTGSKIFYRCNKFKHFGCGYRMYAEIRDRSRIGLYESGFHDHSSRKFRCLSNFL